MRCERQEGVVTNLGEAVGVGADDGQVAPLRLGVILGDVLLHGEEQRLILGGGGRAGKVADVRRLDGVLGDVEE